MKEIVIHFILVISIICLSSNTFKEVIKGSYDMKIFYAENIDNTQIKGIVFSKEDNTPVLVRRYQ